MLGETEGHAIAIQDSLIGTKNYCKYIMRINPLDEISRWYIVSNKTIEHVTGYCTVSCCRLGEHARKCYYHAHQNWISAINS